LISFIGPVDVGPLSITIANLSINLPENKKNFTTCGVYNSSPGDGLKGKMMLAMELPAVPFWLEYWHFELGKIHGGGPGYGLARAILNLTLDYDLTHPALTCSDFEIFTPELELQLDGGGIGAPVVAMIKDAIISIVKGYIPKFAVPLICPAINKLALRLNECTSKIADGPVPWILCILEGYTCKKSPCYGCVHTEDENTAQCVEVIPGTPHSFEKMEDCKMKGCSDPHPHPCVPDGACAKETLSVGCCSGVLHRTKDCVHGKCGAGLDAFVEELMNFVL